jgi:hypothetical protein
VDDFDTEAYKLTPDSAARLAENPEGFRRRLALLNGGDEAQGDEDFMMVRFIQARERDEKPEPTTEEVELLINHYRQTTTFMTLIDMCFRGLAKPDVVVDDAGELEVAWGLTPEGRMAVETDPRYEEYMNDGD